jgi:hypothetical protein
MLSCIVEGAPCEGTGLRALGLLVPGDGGKPTSRPEGTSLTSSPECIGYESCTTREEQQRKEQQGNCCENRKRYISLYRCYLTGKIVLFPLLKKVRCRILPVWPPMGAVPGVKRNLRLRRNCLAPKPCAIIPGNANGIGGLAALFE